MVHKTTNPVVRVSHDFLAWLGRFLLVSPVHSCDSFIDGLKDPLQFGRVVLDVPWGHSQFLMKPLIFYWPDWFPYMAVRSQFQKDGGRSHSTSWGLSFRTCVRLFLSQAGTPVLNCWSQGSGPIDSPSGRKSLQNILAMLCYQVTS